jgi:cobalt-zinc-cadmium efflux system outer membrane protein
MNFHFYGVPRGSHDLLFSKLDPVERRPIRIGRRIGGLLVLVVLMLVNMTPASAADSPSRVSLEQAISAALQSNPALQGFRFQLRAQDARTKQAALRPPTEVAMTLENFAGTGDTRRLNGVEATLALSQVVELGGKRDARIAASDAGRDLLSIEQESGQLDVLAEVTRRFIAVAVRQEQVKLSQTATALAEKTVRNSELRVRAARSPHAEVDRARVAWSRAQLDEKRSMSELVSARRQLSATWGESDGTFQGRPFSSVDANIFQLPEIGTYEDFSNRLALSPDFVRFASATRLRDAELRLATTLRKPDIQLSVGVRRLEATRDQALVASFSVPLFASRRAAPLINESEALRDLVGTERRAAEIKARATLFELYQALTQAVLEADSLRKDTLPRIAEAMKETEYAYSRGRYGYLELVDSQREYLSVQSAMIAASGDAHAVRTEIERLTNGSLEQTHSESETK